MKIRFGIIYVRRIYHTTPFMIKDLPVLVASHVPKLLNQAKMYVQEGGGGKIQR